MQALKVGCLLAVWTPPPPQKGPPKQTDLVGKNFRLYDNGTLSLHGCMHICMHTWPHATNQPKIFSLLTWQQRWKALVGTAHVTDGERSAAIGAVCS